MKAILFGFQKKAVKDLRQQTVKAINSYRTNKNPHIISFSAPTGSGKTIIMASFIENVIYGDDKYYHGQPNAIFVWLSDSPELNEQSKIKIETKADKIKIGHCVTISDENFDNEVLEDGYIYFLNTQKLTKNSNLTRQGDFRQYTIWQTLQNTISKKSDRLYFIIDEAHRGTSGKDENRANTIMQKFIKGSPEDGLSPMPVIIGMSATAQRFNDLVKGTREYKLAEVIVQSAEVSNSGLLKERIFVFYSDDPSFNKTMAVVQEAARDWQKKCKHWEKYCTDQNCEPVNPILVIQVENRTTKTVSKTNLVECLQEIENCADHKFLKGEVVHTFGQAASVLQLGNLEVPYVDPPSINDIKNIKVVFFKENLSTGWDCPRAETMMSFRKAEDATHIAQLLGRMVRTPLQRHIEADEILNDVHLYLPYFDKSTVKKVIDDLQSSENGTDKTNIYAESIEDKIFETLTLFPKTISPNLVDGSTNTTPSSKIDRKQIVDFINAECLPTYTASKSSSKNYLKSLFMLVRLLNHTKSVTRIVDKNNETSVEEIRKYFVEEISKYIRQLKAEGKYEQLTQRVREFKLFREDFDIFGKSIATLSEQNWLRSTDRDIDDQFMEAENKLGTEGIAQQYLNVGLNDGPLDSDKLLNLKIDVILFACNHECLTELQNNARSKFKDLINQTRRYIRNRNWSEENRATYNRLISESKGANSTCFTIPETIEMAFDANGEYYWNHLFVNDQGFVKIKLNDWEKGVLEEEINRDDFVCWLRNSPRTPWALCLPYQLNGQQKLTYPDFIIIRRDPDSNGKYIIDLLEPHNPSFIDNLGKAKGFADYAGNPELLADKTQPIGRIELIRQGKDLLGKPCFKRLDVAKKEIREKVAKAVTSADLNLLFH